MCFIKKAVEIESRPGFDISENTEGHKSSSTIKTTESLALSPFYNFLGFEDLSQIPGGGRVSFEDRHIPSFMILRDLVTQNEAFIGIVDEAVKKNSTKMENLLEEISENLDEGSEVCKRELTTISSCSALEDEVTEGSDCFPCESPLIQKMFYKDSYKYKLELTAPFSSVIYKERNIKLSVKLADKEGRQIKNCNIINLSLKLCDDDGEWIFNNRVGDPMLKGRTDAELYSGCCSFNKIYPQDISRTFKKGTVNLVVYPLPSALVYEENRAEEKLIHVSDSLVQPLIITGVSIMAKKLH